MPRTIVIGDIHGDLAQFEALLPRLPALTDRDRVVFLGDYVDRGPDSAGVVRAVRAFIRDSPADVVCLRGNHEDLWIESYRNEPHLGFLLPRGNGCLETFRSFTGSTADPEAEPSPEEMKQLFEVRAWLPLDVVEWMESLPLWFEDEHAVYVHAGLDGEGHEWKHPRDSRERPLMWMREPDFYANYKGKRVVFGHTKVGDLPVDHLGQVAKLFDDPGDVWVRGDLIGLDTGCGKGGFLSALELPALKVYEGR